MLELFLGCAIIVVVFLVSRLKYSKFNADSLEKVNIDLRERLKNNKTTHDLLESKLHRNILGLQEVLSEEQQSIRAKELELKDKEFELLKNIAEAEKNLEEETETRKKIVSQKKSSEVRLGNIAETLAPFLDQFDFDPENCIFLGKPIDYISFEDEAVTFIEIKSGKAQLSTKQRHIRDLIKAKQVVWKEVRIK
jgi:predicted Holliday junction resolvase-like endonuclease|tara:strand:- start:3458 stop:4039 length:582 start_codon:yes stop_codon:yes gene_type:complete